jgi:hypothetical protein
MCISARLAPCQSIRAIGWLTSKYNPARTFTAEGTVGIGGVYMCIYSASPDSRVARTPHVPRSAIGTKIWFSGPT